MAGCDDESTTAV